ncbi:MAG: GNAT family N-acetyltransferase, partial [Actinomycetota bacterium]
MAVVRRSRSDELRASEVTALRALFDAAWGDEMRGTPAEGFTDDDWDHARGGLHFVLEDGGGIISHASVVERWLETGGHRLATGYVEAVATWPV